LNSSRTHPGVRTGDYRVIYEIRDDVLVILVLAVGHRREIYR
jgi:mRNA interferase RelE/StbE